MYSRNFDYQNKNIMKTKTLLIIIGVAIILNGCTDNSKELLANLRSNKLKLLVCPTHILANSKSSYDSLSSMKIADYLNRNKYASANLTNACPPPNNEWRHNEAKMLTISINLFVEYVKNLTYQKTHTFYTQNF